MASMFIKVVISFKDLRVKNIFIDAKKYSPFLEPVWKIILIFDFITPMEKLRVIKGAKEECKIPSIHINIIIIGLWPKIFRKHLMSVRRLTSHFLRNNFANFAC